VYGSATAAGHGCPWGWARFIDIADPTRPVVRSDFRLAENQPGHARTKNIWGTVRRTAVGDHDLAYAWRLREAFEQDAYVGASSRVGITTESFIWRRV
jgi:hypothetical protein